MGLMGGMKYVMEVAGVSWITSQNTGSRGFQIDFEGPDGAITGVVWVTEKSAEMAERQFKALGATDEQVIDANYMEYQFPVDVLGREVKVAIEEQEYKGKTSLKVNGIYPVVAETASGIGGTVANIFRKAKGLPSAETKPKPQVIDTTGDNLSDDIPF